MVSCTYTSAPSVVPNQQLAIRIAKPTGGVTPTYQLECCHGLPAAPEDWTAIGAAVTGDGTTMTLVDPAPSQASQRFYRVRISH